VSLHRVFFARDLTNPVRISAGSYHSIDSESFHLLRATPDGLAAVVDLTPHPLVQWFDAMAGRPPLSTRPTSSVGLFPCPDCTRVDGGRVSLTKAYTHCETCDNGHSIVAPMSFTQRDMAAYREHFKKAVSSILEKRKSP